MSRFQSLSAILLLALSLGTYAADTDETRVEKFAVAAEGKEASATISDLTGRAPFFHLFDDTGNLLEVLPNTFLELDFGIGPRAATLLAEHKVTVLVGGQAGPKMQKVLDESAIRFVHRKGTVQEIADELGQ